MTNEQIIQAITKYESVIRKRINLDWEIPPHPIGIIGVSYYDKCVRAIWMCGEIRKFINEGRLDKANRWLGFIQGVLYCENFYSILELKEDNT